MMLPDRRGKMCRLLPKSWEAEVILILAGAQFDHTNMEEAISTLKE